MNWKQVRDGEIDDWADDDHEDLTLGYSLMRELTQGNPNFEEIAPGVWRETGGYGNSGPGWSVTRSSE